MKTEGGIKLLEYNFRPGDPEWINTLSIIDSNLVDVIGYLINEVQEPVNFEDKATVCKYIVPNGYPEITDQVLNIRFDARKINEFGVKIYYSSGLDNKGKLRVGCERGIAFVSKGDSILRANDKVEKAISMIEGDFHYREDIGTGEMI
jgi:phosphoribosylamine--glycine ligase